MSDDFKIEIPIEFSGGSGGGKSKKSDKGLDELNKNVKKLDKTVYGTLDIFEMLSSVLGDVYKLLQPIFKLMSILLLIIFMPLMPLIKLIVQGLAWLASIFSGKEGDLVQMLGKLLLAILIGIFVFIVSAIGGPILAVIAGIVLIIALLWDYIVLGAKIIWEGLKWVWENLLLPAFMKLWDGLIWIWEELLKPAWEWLKNMFLTIWNDIIKPAFMFLINVGAWIWNEILKPAFNWLSNVGQKIWEILKAPFDWLASKIKSINIFGSSKSSSKTSKSTKSGGDFILRPNGDMIKSSPRDTIIATKEPHKLGGMGSVTVNINNPSVRNDMDIKKIAEETSKILERKLWRSY